MVDCTRATKKPKTSNKNPSGKVKEFKFPTFIPKKKSYLFYNKCAINGEIQLESNDNNRSFFSSWGYLKHRKWQCSSK